MHRIKYTLAVSGLILGLSACQSVNQPLSPLHGEASQKNFEAMVDDPRPAEGDPTTDARVVDAAMDRYRSGNVEALEDAGDFASGGG